jgi:hypothetical protein
MKSKPIEKPPEDSLKQLRDFTKRILSVPKNEIHDKGTSDGPKKIEEPCPDA